MRAFVLSLLALAVFASVVAAHGNEQACTAGTGTCCLCALAVAAQAAVLQSARNSFSDRPIVAVAFALLCGADRAPSEMKYRERGTKGVNGIALARIIGPVGAWQCRA